jgi:hypothetical protein
MVTVNSNEKSKIMDVTDDSKNQQVPEVYNVINDETIHLVNKILELREIKNQKRLKRSEPPIYLKRRRLGLPWFKPQDNSGVQSASSNPFLTDEDGSRIADLSNVDLLMYFK